MVIKPRMFGTVARQPALPWQAVCTQTVVGGLKCYHPSMKWIQSMRWSQFFIHIHICHLLSMELASTLVRSLILTRLDYCNSLLHGSLTSSIHTLQRVQNNAARIVLQASRRCHANPLLRQLHWLPVRHGINYSLAVMTYNIRSITLLPYLSYHIKPQK